MFLLKDIFLFKSVFDKHLLGSGYFDIFIIKKIIFYKTKHKTVDTSDAANDEKDATVKCGDLANLAFFEDVFSCSHHNRDLKLNKTAASDVAVKILLLKILHSRFYDYEIPTQQRKLSPKSSVWDLKPHQERKRAHLEFRAQQTPMLRHNITTRFMNSCLLTVLTYQGPTLNVSELFNT